MASKAAPAAPKPDPVPGPVSTPAPAGIGDNSLSNADKREVVYRVHMKNLRGIKRELDEQKDVLKAIGKRWGQARNAFKHDTDIDLANLDRILKKSEMTRADLTKDANDYAYMCEMEAIPIGGQLALDFEAKTPTIPKDEFYWEAEGKRSYHRNVECKPPSECPPKNIPDWTRGWQAEQERTAWAMSENGRIIDRDPEKPRAASPPPLDDEPADARPSIAAGYKTFELEGGRWSAEYPDGSEFEDDYETEEAALDACDADWTSKQPVLN